MATENNLFEFFEKMLDTPNIKGYWEIIYVNYDYVKLFIKEVNFKENTVLLDPNYFDPIEQDFVLMSFEEFATDLVIGTSIGTLRRINEKMLSLSTDKSENYIFRILQNLSALITKTDNYFKDNSELHFVSESLVGLQSELRNRYLSIELSYAKDKVEHEPVTWNAGVAAIGTLFFELSKSLKTPTGLPIIDASVNKLVAFIQANFIDEKGEPFETSSLKKYLYPNDKIAKRNRVPIERIFPNKK